LTAPVPDFRGECAEVLANGPAADGLYVMRLHSPTVAESARPAQFVNVLTDSGRSPYLRRPFSVLRVDRQAGWFDIYYDVIGPGTNRLATLQPGQSVDLIGPLGRPFTPPAADRILLVAGGVGIVPLSFLAWDNAHSRARSILLMGAAGSARMPDMEAVVPNDLEYRLATDDGSLGHHGFVTDLIEPHVLPGRTVVFTCGPHAMMARVAEISRRRELPCFASLEKHMACGFGACVGCVVEYRNADRDDERYRRVCVEGPVVDAGAIVW